jgi:hypothetical protein
MKETSRLIDALVETATPVRRLRPPALRACGWLLLAAVVLMLLSVAHGLRSDIVLKLQQPVFMISMAGALATAVLAALAAFNLSLPDRSNRWLLLPVPALVIWISTIGYGCLTDWVSMSPDGMRMGETARCFATLLLTSVPLSAAMLVMLRYAARIRPRLISAVGGLATAAMTAFALSIIHDIDATVMVLFWNLGISVLIAATASAFGARAFSWASSRISGA